MRFTTKAANVVKNPSVWLWTVQGLLAALFLLAGVSKLVMSAEQMRGPIEFPLFFLRFLGVAEATGAIGLILPALLRIKPALTPVAALSLISIMVGAVSVSFIEGGLAMAAFPFVVGILLMVVAYGRFRVAPVQARRAARLVLQPAA